MTDRPRHLLAMTLLTCVGAAVFFGGIRWGLPTRAGDRYLFPAGDAWDGKRVLAAGGTLDVDAARGADQDATPDVRPDGVLNATAAERAQIVRRYRLFSHQPDEMVTFMALAGMRGSFDPRMYQYGGLWVYPVGGLVKLTLSPKADLAHYLDRPEEFAKFYVVARAYSAAWGLVGIWLVYLLAWRLTANARLAAVAGLGFALLPVVVNGAHEAKPHLAGAVLVLLTVLSAARYVDRGRWRDALVAGACAGAATGMVLSSAVAFLVLPMMVVLRREAWSRRIGLGAGSIGAGVLVYCLTNPFVPINLVRNPAVLKSNLGGLGQAKAITGRFDDAPAVVSAGVLIAEGTSPLLAAVGAVAVLGLVGRAVVRRRVAPGAVLLGVPCVVVFVQFVALAGGKTGEFGRFTILVDVGLLMAVVVGASVVIGEGSRWMRLGAAVVIGLMVAPYGLSYVGGFVRDCDWAGSTRARAAARLAELAAANPGRRPLVLAVEGSPGPYNVPPVDVAGWEIVRRGWPAGANPAVIVRPVDVPNSSRGEGGYVRETIVPSGWGFANRISWADKPIELLIRRDLVGQ
ncbi:MAG TPA: glycosyltransferase family 39 protein [Tepidisphaeraceae bacterium]|nr:glycosyltransferase family 39 protein [Tepidisphaeraceae bacterium]